MQGTWNWVFRGNYIGVNSVLMSTALKRLAVGRSERESVPTRAKFGNLGILGFASVARALSPGFLLLLPDNEPILKTFWLLLVATYVPGEPFHHPCSHLNIFHCCFCSIAHVPGFLSESAGVSKRYEYWLRTMPSFAIVGMLLGLAAALFIYALSVTSPLEAIVCVEAAPFAALALLWVQLSLPRAEV
jgi:hypothetical protein